jgi:hypothetical protein
MTAGPLNGARQRAQAFISVYWLAEATDSHGYSAFYPVGKDAHLHLTRAHE